MISEEEINARFAMLSEQRNGALNNVVVISGEYAVLKKKFDELEKELEELKTPKE